MENNILTEVDKQSLEYKDLIQFCEKHNITDIDAHYYLKLAYNEMKSKLSRNEIENIFQYMYNAFEDIFWKQK